MKWPWEHRVNDASRAAKKAKRDFEEVVNRREDVDKLIHKVREQRLQNHIVEGLKEILGGKP